MELGKHTDTARHLHSRAGLSGHVVDFGMTGNPTGFNPNAAAPYIIVDPDLPTRTEVDLSQWSKRQMDEATLAMGDPVNDVEGQRVQAAEFYQRLAAGAPAAAPEVAATPPHAPIHPPAAHGQRPIQTASFGAPSQPTAVATPEQPRTSQPPPSVFENHQHLPPSPPPAPVPAAPALVPGIKVAFEVKGVPFKTEAYYHQVIREGACLVLVFDTRAQGYPRVYPQTTENDMAVYIDGRDTVYVVKTTGMKFVVDHNEIAILLVSNEVPLQHPAAL